MYFTTNFQYALNISNMKFTRPCPQIKLHNEIYNTAQRFTQ